MEADREKLLDLIVRWEEAKAQGAPAVPEEICRDCPQLLTRFRREVASLEQVDWLNDSFQTGISASASASASDSAWDSPHELSLPRLLAERYRLDVLVGEGGFGRVYQGFDTWLERPVALKIPRSNRPVSSGNLDQCRIEARKVAQLRHPNIVPVHDVGREGTSCFIVGEWIEGTNLALRIKNERLAHDVAARIVADVADALDHAHRAGFVHRDVKPANILVDGQGKAYLTDFGIAVLEVDLPGTQGGVGTLPYMAPEQLSEAFGPIDPRADLYSLGVVLFELLTGRRPFVAVTALELREQIVSQAPPSLRSLDASVPERLERICLRTLAKQAADRYPSVDLLAADLRLVWNG